MYDDDVYGTRIICTTEDGEKPVNSFITIQTYCYNVDDLTLTWTLVEESEDEPPKKIEMKASFESEEIVASFIKAFEEVSFQILIFKLTFKIIGFKYLLFDYIYF